MTRRTSLFWFALAALVVSGCNETSISGARTARAQAAPEESVVTRRIWSGPEADNEGFPSPDGRFLTFADWRPGESGNLAVFEISTREIRVLTKANGPFAEVMSFTSLVSPDGQHVLYLWFAENEYSLRLINMDGSGGRTILELPEDGELSYAEPEAWSPDGSTVVVVLSLRDRTKRIALLSLADGTMRTLKSLDWRAPDGMAYSPDGRYIAYDLPRHDGMPQRDVLVLAADGGREQLLIDHPADDRLLAWSNDGRSVLFSSDRGSSPGVWAVDVRDGRAVSAPRLLKGDMWRMSRTLGTDRTGALYYSVLPTVRTAYTTTLDPISGAVMTHPAPVDERARRGNSPVWSPDGAFLAYVTQATDFPASGIGNFRIVVRSLAAGESRELVPKLNAIQDLEWFPDGESLLIRGANDKGRYGLYRVDARTGAIVASYFRPGGKEHFFGAMLAPDGKSVYYRTFTGEKDEISQVMQRDLGREVERELYRVRGHIGWPSPSPDGSEIAFTVSPQSAPTSVYVMPANGDPAREIVRLPEGIVSYPNSGPITWQGEGHLLFVAGERASETAWIARVPRAGGEVQRIDVSVPGARVLRLHPDGRRLAFQGGRDSTEIWVMEPPRNVAR